MTVSRNFLSRYVPLLYTPWAHHKGQKSPSPSQPLHVTPLYYEIYDSSGKKRGSFLGVDHNLSERQLTFLNIPSVFDPQSEIYQSFEQASVFAGEISIVKHFSRTKTQLYMESQTRQNMDGFFEATAYFSEKTVAELETPTQQYIAKQLDVLVRTQLHKQALPKSEQNACSNTTLRRLFIKGSAPELVSYDQKCSSREELLWDKKRNHEMAKTTDKLLKTTRGTVFGAVGFFHLIGENSIPKELEKMGWEVRRRYPNTPT